MPRLRQPEAYVARLAEGAGEPLFSRPTEPSFLGKCDTRIEIPAPHELRDSLCVLANLEQQALATYIRGVLEGHVLREGGRVERIISLFNAQHNPRNRG